MGDGDGKAHGPRHMRISCAKYGINQAYIAILTVFNDIVKVSFWPRPCKNTKLEISVGRMTITMSGKIA